MESTTENMVAVDPDEARVVERRTGPRQRSADGRWASPRYWVCATILLISAVGMQVLPRALGVFLRKEAVPLRQPLQHFDTSRLLPRYERHPSNDDLRPVSEEVLDSLGTREYLELFLTDTDREPGDPARLGHVFVTYYTGRPDMVPHVPDECYVAAGYELVGTSNNQVRVVGVGAPDDLVPVRSLHFRTAEQRRTMEGDNKILTVMYFFHANGGYTCTRDGVRARLANPFQRHAYYAKIEVSFPQMSSQDREQGQAASLASIAPLLEALLPVLLNEYFDLDCFSGAGLTESTGS